MVNFCCLPPYPRYNRASARGRRGSHPGRFLASGGRRRRGSRRLEIRASAPKNGRFRGAKPEVEPNRHLIHAARPLPGAARARGSPWLDRSSAGTYTAVVLAPQMWRRGLPCPFRVLLPPEVPGSAEGAIRSRKSKSWQWRMMRRERAEGAACDHRGGWVGPSARRSGPFGHCFSKSFRRPPWAGVGTSPSEPIRPAAHQPRTRAPPRRRRPAPHPRRRLRTGP